jgi:predicted nucleic acid-binding protein
VAVIYLPDTNAWISYLRRNSPALVQRFAGTNPSDIRLCSVVVGELIYGVFHGPSSHVEPRSHSILISNQP